MKGAATGRVPWSNRGVHRVCQQARCRQWLTSRLSDGVHVAVRRIHVPWWVPGPGCYVHCLFQPFSHAPQYFGWGEKEAGPFGRSQMLTYMLSLSPLREIMDWGTSFLALILPPKGRGDMDKNEAVLTPSMCLLLDFWLLWCAFPMGFLDSHKGTLIGGQLPILILWEDNGRKLVVYHIAHVHSCRYGVCGSSVL